MTMRLALKVVEEWCRLSDQDVVSQRWEPGAIAKNLSPRSKASVVGETTAISTMGLSRTSRY